MLSLLLRLLANLRAFLLRYWLYLYPAPPQKKVTPAHYGPDGQGYARSPDWMKATAEDEGQWDGWKRQMRIALWRAKNDLPWAAGAIDLREAGVAIRPNALPSNVPLASLRSLPEMVPALYPFDVALAQACRELGFLRLARAAMPEEGDLFFHSVYITNSRQARLESETIYARNVATKANPSPGLNPELFTFETVEQTMAMFDLGGFERPDLDHLPPLAPLAIGQNGEGMPQSPELRIQ